MSDYGFPIHPAPPAADADQQIVDYIADMPAGEHVVDTWCDGPLQIAVIGPWDSDPAYTVELVAGAYPPAELADGALALIAPALLAHMAQWYSEFAYRLVFDDDRQQLLRTYRSELLSLIANISDHELLSDTLDLVFAALEERPDDQRGALLLAAAPLLASRVSADLDDIAEAIDLAVKVVTDPRAADVSCTVR